MPNKQEAKRTRHVNANPLKPGVTSFFIKDNLGSSIVTTALGACLWDGTELHITNIYNLILSVN